MSAQLDDSHVSSGSVSSAWYVVRGVAFLFRNRILWKYAAAPMAISAILFGGSYIVLYHLLSRWLGQYRSEEWYLQGLYYLLLILFVILLFVIFFFFFSRVVSAIAAPFNDLISQKTEALVMGNSADIPFSIAQCISDAVRSLSHGVKVLALYVGIIIVCLWLLLFPVVGQVLFATVACMLSALMFSYEYLSYPMDRRRYSWNDKKSFFRSRFRAVMGFGLGAAGLAAIPFLNILFIPAAVVGGTLLFLDQTNAQPVGSSRQGRN